MNLAFGHNVAAAHQDDLVRHLVDFVQDVAGDDYVQPLLAQRLE